MRDLKEFATKTPLSLALILVVLVTAGCSTRIGDFSIVSTGTPQYTKMVDAPVKTRIKGSDGVAWLLFIPLGSRPTLENAVDDCMDRGRGDYIERARFYRTGWTVIVISYTGYSVIGDVGNSKY